MPTKNLSNSEQEIFFLGHELDSFQSMHGCGPPDIPSIGEPLRPSGLFFFSEWVSTRDSANRLIICEAAWLSAVPQWVAFWRCQKVSCGQRTSLNFCMTSPSLHMPRGLALWRSCISCISSKRWEMLPSISTGHRENHGDFKLSMFQFESEVRKPFCPGKNYTNVTQMKKFQRSLPTLRAH